MTQTTPTKRTVKARRSKRSQPVIEIQPEGPKRATCGLCGAEEEFGDWSELGGWLSRHLSEEHPEELQRLVGVSGVFLTWLISQCYETEPDWNAEPSVAVIQRDLGEILAGKRDPLVDGMTGA